MTAPVDEVERQFRRTVIFYPCGKIFRYTLYETEIFQDELRIRGAVIILVKIVYPPCRIVWYIVHPPAFGGLIPTEFKRIFYLRRIVEETERRLRFGIYVAYPHQTIPLYSVPDVTVFKTEPERIRGGCPHGVQKFVVAGKFTPFGPFVGIARRDYRFYDELSARREVYSQKSETGLSERHIRPV